jgi:polysaccharide deacetylase family protein (PEP-CTERM system associated)
MSEEGLNAQQSRPPRCGLARHILSVDVEDYFQVEAFSDQVSRECWDCWPLRVQQNTERLLDIFDSAQTKATFFVLGWVAAKLPGLVREIANRGHELACHSYWHRCIYTLDRPEFQRDTRMAKTAIEQAAGVRVRGYRAPSWSITPQSLWALEVLAEEGFQYDSSIYPIHHDVYGLPGAPVVPYTHCLDGGYYLREFPPATVRLWGATLPAAGGGYLRLFPFLYTAWAIQRIESMPGQQVVVYLHPWEIDTEQPRIAGRLRSRLRHYSGLANMEDKLRRLLSLRRFQSFHQFFENDHRQAAVESSFAKIIVGSTLASVMPPGGRPQ